MWLVLGGIKKRDLEDVLNTDHNKTHLGYTPNTPAEILFAGQNSCVLTPEVTLGPYCECWSAVKTTCANNYETLVASLFGAI